MLLEWTRWSLISLIATVALFAIITSFLWATLANALNRCELRLSVPWCRMRVIFTCPCMVQRGVSLANAMLFNMSFSIAITWKAL